MSRTEHPLERRSRLLGGAIKARLTTLRDAIAPEGERKPWTTQMTRSDALAFWRTNRYTPEGLAILQTLPPQDVMALDVELARVAANEQMMGTGDGGL